MKSINNGYGRISIRRNKKGITLIRREARRGSAEVINDINALNYHNYSELKSEDDEEDNKQPSRCIQISDFLIESCRNQPSRKRRNIIACHSVRSQAGNYHDLFVPVNGQIDTPILLHQHASKITREQHDRASGKNKTLNKTEKEDFILNYLREDLRNEFKDLLPSVQLSRIGSKANGSLRVQCEESRVIMLVMWSVKNGVNPFFVIRTVPILNLSPFQTSYLLEVGKCVTARLTSQFDCQHTGCSDCEHISSDLQLYIRVSRFIISSLSEIKDLILDKIGFLSIKRKTKVLSPIHQSLKAAKLEPSQSLDYFDVYSLAEKAEMDKIIREESKVVDIDEDLGQESGNESCKGFCPICFDKFNGDEMSLASCSDHKFCSSCWRALIVSAVSSGEAVIKCPSFRCSRIIGLHDVAFILLDQFHQDTTGENVLSAIETIMRLVKFQVEQYITTFGSITRKPGEKIANFHFCASPSCKNIFAFPTVDTEIKVDRKANNGTNIIFCDCGTSMCGSCGGKSSSHLGLTCKKYRKLRKDVDSGRMDAEFKSLLWVKRNTEDCPKCKFPIIKNGGCNHMWCKKCDYYFCWICKGPGGACKPYRCYGKTGSPGNDDGSSGGANSSKLPNRIDRLLNYVSTEITLQETMKKRLALSGDATDTNIYIVQLLLWIRAFQLSRQSSKLYATAQRLELILSVLLSSNECIIRTKNTIRNSSLFDEKAFAALETFRNDAMRRSTRRRRTTTTSIGSARKIQARKSIARKREDRGRRFHDASVDEVVHFSQLCTMSPNRLRAHAKREVRQSTSDFLRVVVHGENRRAEQRHRKRQRKRARVAAAKDGLVKDERLKPRRSRSWKKATIDDENTPSTNEDENVETKTQKPMKWKGKRKLKARRTFALDAHFETFNTLS